MKEQTKQFILLLYWELRSGGGGHLNHNNLDDWQEMEDELLDILINEGIDV